MKAFLYLTGALILFAPLAMADEADTPGDVIDDTGAS